METTELRERLHEIDPDFDIIIYGAGKAEWHSHLASMRYKGKHIYSIPNKHLYKYPTEQAKKYGLRFYDQIEKKVKKTSHMTVWDLGTRLMKQGRITQIDRSDLVRK